MSSENGYHDGMQRANWAQGAGFALIGVALFLASVTAAQVNGAPPSVTSLGFGGRSGSIRGTAPSVTSLGPRGYAGGRGTTSGLFGVNPSQNINRPHRRRGVYYPWGAYYGVPYYGYDDSGYDAEDQAGDQYNGGPTIFDRRGPGRAATEVEEPRDNRASRESSETAVEPVESTPEVEQPATVLVFKDGRQLEVENYAIVGDTLYDLTVGGRHKISLADLDLTATAKENDDRGVDFQLPGSAAN